MQHLVHFLWSNAVLDPALPLDRLDPDDLSDSHVYAGTRTVRL